MPGGGLPGVGRFTMGGKHNESWVQTYRTFFKKASLLKIFFQEFFIVFFNGAVPF